MMENDEEKTIHRHNFENRINNNTDTTIGDLYCIECFCGDNDHPPPQPRATKKKKIFKKKVSTPAVTNNVVLSIQEEHTAVIRTRLIITSGLCCSSEVPTIKNIISSLPGVQHVRVNVATKMVLIDYPAATAATTASSIVNLLQTQGFSSHILEDVGETNQNTTPNDQKIIHWNVVFSGIFWVVSMLSYIGGPWQYCKYAGILSVVFGLPPVARKAWKTVRRCEFDANCMMVIAAVGAVILQQYDEAASVSFLFSISEWLESRATLRARKALTSIVNLRPDRANRILVEERPDYGDTNRSFMNYPIAVVSASSLTVNSLVSVRTGEKIPTDGFVVEGISTVDESSLTGEARPVRKAPGDKIAGGSINIGSSPIIAQTTSTVENSAVSRLVKLVEESQIRRSPTEKLVDQFARSYTPIVILLAINMCIVPWIIAGPVVGQKWILNGLILIVLACPCALTISTPVTYAAGLAATAQNGVIIKGGATLEALGRVNQIVFDKTGTLTQGKFTMGNLQVIGEKYSKIQVLQLLALMESSSSHPLASALVHAAHDEGVDIPSNIIVNNHISLQGEGVTASLSFDHRKEPVQCYVGNQMLMQRVGLLSSLPHGVIDEVQSWSFSGGTVGYLGLESEGIIAAFCVLDSIRPEAKVVVADLKDRLKFDITILTGDSFGAARALADQIGFSDHEEEVKSQLLPEEKLQVVQRMMMESENKTGFCKSHGLLLFCGDGVNDAPSMSAADVSVAMGSGAALALETCDITLMDCNLKKLVYSIDMGKRVLCTVKENILFSLLSKLVVVGLTFASKTTLLIAIATDLGVMLLVTLNGMKLLPDRNTVDFKESHAKNTGKRKREGRKLAYFEVPTGNTNIALPAIS